MEKEHVDVNYQELFERLDKAVSSASILLDTAKFACDEILLNAGAMEVDVLEDYDERLWDFIHRLQAPTQYSNEEVDYKKLYVGLFNQITYALDSLERCNYGRTRDILQDAQREAGRACVEYTGDSTS